MLTFQKTLKTTLILIAILSFSPAQGQNTEIIDSLELAYQATDSIKQKQIILNQLCRYTQRSQPKIGRRYAEMYDSLAKLETNPIPLGKGAILIGSSDYMDGKYVEATSKFLEGLDHFIDAKDSSFIGSAYNNLAVVWMARKDTLECINYLTKSYDYYKSTGNPRRLAVHTSNMAQLMYATGKYEDAKEFAQKSIDYHIESRSFGEAGKPLETLANISYAEEDYQQVIKLVEEAVSSLDPARSTPTLIRLHIKKGNSLMQLNQKGKAKRSYDNAKALLGEGKFQKEEESLSKAMTSYYEKVGQWKNAHESYQRYISLRDSSLNVAKDVEIEEIVQKYENDKKSQEIELLNSKNALTQTRLTSANRGNIALGVGLALLSGLGWWIYALYKKTQSQNQIISKALDEKNTLLKEIHHRVKNNLQFISSLLRLQTKHVSDSAALDALQEGQDRVQSMALIHQNLYQEDNLTGVDMNEYFEKLIKGLFDSYNIYDERIQLELDIADIRLDVDTVIPMGLIANELISNSLKHAFPDARAGVIKVSLARQNKILLMGINDNGVGISEEDRVRSEDSFGYKLINAFCQQLEGEMVIDTSDGTKVDFAIHSFVVK